MEPIKITDKITLRQEALRLSVATGTNHPVSQAQQYEAYLLGDAELPEYEDTHKDFKEMLGKFQESFKPNPWISADSEIKPAKGTPVICALHYGISKIEYVVMYYNHEEKEWCGGNDDDNTNHVVAWCPIAPYQQPIKL